MSDQNMSLQKLPVLIVPVPGMHAFALQNLRGEVYAWFGWVRLDAEHFCRYMYRELARARAESFGFEVWEHLGSSGVYLR